MGCHDREIHVQSYMQKLLRDNSGATAIEYGLIVGLISVSIIIGLQSFGDQLVVLYQVVDGYTANAANKP